MQKTESLERYKAERAIRILVRERAGIRTVKQWARESGISESSLNKMLYAIYGQTPGEILKQVKYEKIIRVLSRDLNACVYSIAIDSEFNDEAAMRMFLRRRYDTNISMMREQFLQGHLSPVFNWLTDL